MLSSRRTYLDRPRAAAALTISVLLCLVSAACGGGGSKVSAAKSSLTTPSTTSTSTTPTNTSGSSAKPAGGSRTAQPLASPRISTSVGNLRASLHAANHAPKVNQAWHYSVLATDQSRHPIAGTVATEFVLGNTVVGRETPPTHPLKTGRLDDIVRFPAQATGIGLTFRVVVHTGLGSATLDWAVKVRA
jgi:hypothetical protein